MDKFIFRKEYYEVLKELKYDYEKKDFITAILTYLFDKDDYDETIVSDRDKPLFNLVIKLIEKDEVDKYYSEVRDE